MNKLTKGAIAMVLVGAITFSVTNALFADHSTKNSTHASTNSENRKIANNMNQSNETLNRPTNKTFVNVNLSDHSVKGRTPIMDATDRQATTSDNHNAYQLVSFKGNMVVAAIPAVKSNAATSSTEAATTNKPIQNSATSSAATPIGTTTKPASTTVPTTSTTSTKINHGTKSSQAAKAKAVSNQNLKKYNAKK